MKTYVIFAIAAAAALFLAYWASQAFGAEHIHDETCGHLIVGE